MFYLFSIFRRGQSLLFFKYPAEIQRIFISDDMSNLCHSIVGSFQKHLRIGNSYSHNILHGCSAGILFEIADKPAYAHAL